LDPIRAKALVEADKRHVWHPFTQMGDWEREEPFIVEAAEGCWLIGQDGERYLDGVSSLWVNVHGHRKPEIDEAVREQLDKVAHATFLGLANPPAIELAERLVRIAPHGLERVFYSDNGSTAVEIAVKMAYQYWQNLGEETSRKRKFIAFTNAYHGDTIGAVSLGGIDLFHGVYGPLLFDVVRAPYPHPYRDREGRSAEQCVDACLAELEARMESHRGELAGLVIEPLVQGAAGMIMSPPGCLAGVRELCNGMNCLMIVDEVATGFGRTGRMFACEHEGVSPDLLCLAKGLTAGYLPMAATLATGKVYEGFLADYSEMKHFFHGHTYTGNPLAAAAAIASLKLFDSEETLERMQPRIERLRAGLERFRDHPNVGDVRQHGFMVGIELVRDRETKETHPPAEKVAMRICREARDRRLIIRPLGPVLTLMPALAIDDDELDFLLEVVWDSLEAVLGPANA